MLQPGSALTEAVPAMAAATALGRRGRTRPRRRPATAGLQATPPLLLSNEWKGRVGIHPVCHLERGCQESTDHREAEAPALQAELCQEYQRTFPRLGGPPAG